MMRKKHIEKLAYLGNFHYLCSELKTKVLIKIIKTMKGKKMVFVALHGDIFRELLFYWLSYHPRLKWWRSGEGLSCESVTMSETAWRSFCRDFNFKFTDL